MHEVYEFLKQCGTYYLATDEAGQPRVRPFGTVNLFEGKLYIQMGKSKAVSRQIAQNPRVELCGLQGEQWVRVSATLVEDDRLEPQRAMLEVYPDLRRLYQPGDGNVIVFFLKDATGSFYSFVCEPRVVRF